MQGNRFGVGYEDFGLSCFHWTISSGTAQAEVLDCKQKTITNIILPLKKLITEISGVIIYAIHVLVFYRGRLLGRLRYL